MSFAVDPALHGSFSGVEPSAGYTLQARSSCLQAWQALTITLLSAARRCSDIR